MKKILGHLAIGSAVLFAPLVAQAQSVLQQQTAGSGFLNQLRNLLTPITTTGNVTIASLFSSILQLVIIIAAIVAILYLIWAGIKYITASTDEEAAKKARTAVYNAIIGIIIIILSFVIIQYVRSLVQSELTGTTPGSGINTGLPGGINTGGGLQFNPQTGQLQ